METIRAKRPITARAAAEIYGVSIRTIKQWNSQTREDWLNDQRQIREAIRVYHDVEGHSWPQTAAHFSMSQSAVRQRCYRARRELGEQATPEQLESEAARLEAQAARVRARARKLAA